MNLLQLWFIKGVLFLSETANVTFLCNFPWKHSVSFLRHKEWLLWQSLHAALPRGSGFRAEFRRKFECLASCNSLREAEPRLLELQWGFSRCLSFLNEGNSCVFSQGILNFSNHILLSHKYRQVKLKLNTDLTSHNFSSDLWDSVFCLRACFVSCAILTAANQGKVLPQAIWGKVLPWTVQDNWILGQFFSHSGTTLTLGIRDWTPSQFLIGKKVLAPFLCRYLFCSLFICSDLLPSIRKSKGFVMILADTPTGKICKQLQHMFRSLASPL